MVNHFFYLSMHCDCCASLRRIFHVSRCSFLINFLILKVILLYPHILTLDTCSMCCKNLSDSCLSKGIVWIGSFLLYLSLPRLFVVWMESLTAFSFTNTLPIATFGPCHTVKTSRTHCYSDSFSASSSPTTLGS